MPRKGLTILKLVNLCLPGPVALKQTHYRSGPILSSYAGDLGSVLIFTIQMLRIPDSALCIPPE